MKRIIFILFCLQLMGIFNSETCSELKGKKQSITDFLNKGEFRKKCEKWADKWLSLLKSNEVKINLRECLFEKSLFHLKLEIEKREKYSHVVSKEQEEIEKEAKNTSPETVKEKCKASNISTLGILALDEADKMVKNLNLELLKDLYQVSANYSKDGLFSGAYAVMSSVIE